MSSGGDRGREKHRDRRRERLALGGILVLALVLRVAGMGGRIFEEDELYTLRDSLDFGAAARADGAPGILGRPLYYLMQHVLLLALPAEPAYLRLPAVVFGVVGVWLTWKLGREIFGPVGAAVGAWLVAVSPWHVLASQTARYWSLIYLWAVLSALLIFRVLGRDRSRSAMPAASTGLLLGSLTHPSFLFPMLGLTVGAAAVTAEGKLAPLRRVVRDLVVLWAPVVAVLGLGWVLLSVTGNQGAVRNWSGRGLEATLRLVPAMVQWITPAVALAAIVAALFLMRTGREDRHWGVAASLGAVTALVLLMAASFRTNVYADYGIAMLPLVYVTVGGGVSRLSGQMKGWAAKWFPVAATGVLIVGVAPGLLSHLSDGTRFDYRPAYRYVAESTAPDRPLVASPVIVQRHYAPHLRLIEFRADSVFLSRVLAREGSVWLIASRRRYGIVGGEPVSRWIDGHCRLAMTTERPRFDYRRYRTELHWCGDAPVPGPASHGGAPRNAVEKGAGA